MILIFFIIGLVIGSFLNVVAMRMRSAEKIFWSRSKCPHCQSLIRWYDNIPVLSFVLLRGKCRDCRKKISWVYPLIEVFTGLIFALAGWKFFNLADAQSWWITGYYWFVLSSLIVILIYDWLYLEIPVLVLWPVFFIALVFNLWADGSLWLANPDFFSASLFQSSTYSGTFAAVIAFSIFFSLSFFSKEKWMGMGDAYLVVLLGVFLGWPEISSAIFLAFLFGSAYGLMAILSKKKTLKSQVPFAPFLVLGTIIALFSHSALVNWYFSLFWL
jgi:leader peptidase (prepilin peptidase)/N-methyltransferase